MIIGKISFPEFTGTRCLMMPYIQGDASSVPEQYRAYNDILNNVYVKKYDIGYLTIDESFVEKGVPQRATRAKHERALHTEAGRHPSNLFSWGSGTWGGSPKVILDRDVKVLLANNIDESCAVWETDHTDTTTDGDIGHLAELYPYHSATILKAGEVHEIGIFTPHESLPVKQSCNRQFLRIVSSGVNGTEDYFTKNPLLEV